MNLKTSLFECGRGKLSTALLFSNPKKRFNTEIIGKMTWNFNIIITSIALFFSRPLLSRTTPTLMRPSHAWWRTSWPWRRREPWATRRPPPPRPKQRAASWFFLASTTTRRRRDSVGVRDAPRLTPETETTTDGGHGWVWNKRLDYFVEWCNLKMLPHSPSLCPHNFISTEMFEETAIQ